MAKLLKEAKRVKKVLSANSEIYSQVRDTHDTNNIVFLSLG